MFTKNHLVRSTDPRKAKHGLAVVLFSSLRHVLAGSQQELAQKAASKMEVMLVEAFRAEELLNSAPTGVLPCPLGPALTVSGCPDQDKPSAESFN